MHVKEIHRAEFSEVVPGQTKPTSPAEAAKNRRVEFALIKVSAEAVIAADFDF